MSLSRSTFARYLLPVVLLAVFFFSLPLTGCGNQPEPTATPTKTPTAPVTPTSALIAAAQALPTFTATPTSLPTHTPLPTEPPTATPVPPAVTATPVLSNTVTEEEMDDLKMANSNSAEDKDAAGGDTQPLITAPTKAPTPTPEPPPTGPTEMNPLTGLQVAASKLNRRPLGIKVPNFPWEARPQSGLSKADVVIEHEAEANLTRFTAIFYAGDSWEIGPTRSVRLVDGELMSIFKAALVTSGGHPAVKIRATEGKSWASGYKRIICPEEPFLGDGGALYRVAKNRRYELTLYSDTPTLRNVVAARGVNQRPDFSHFWTFSDAPPDGGNSATYLRVVYKPQWSITEYRYDAGSRTYKRFDVGKATTDATTGQQIAPSNVLVLYANHVNSDIAADTHDPNNIYYSVIIQIWGEGSGKLLRDGKVYDVKWVRENPQQPNDRLILLDGAGNRLPLRPGSTWIQLVRPNGDVTIQ